MEKWVVVVDDDIVNLKRTGTILSENGIHATAMKSGKALLEFLKSNTPDLILLDILMPEMDGLETLRRMREEIRPDAAIPVIMMTADEGHDLEARSFRMEAADFIRKPFDADALIWRVRKALAENRSRESAGPKTPEIEGNVDLEKVIAFLEKQEEVPGIWMGKDAFTSVYHYLQRYMERYHGIACQVLFTVRVHPEEADEEEAERLPDEFRTFLQKEIRSSDLMMKIGRNRLFLLLPNVHDYEVDRVVGRLMEDWSHCTGSRNVTVSYEAGQIRLNQPTGEADGSAYHVALTDDDPVDLKAVTQALRADHIRVTALQSGEELLSYIESHEPDLILLDIRMPGTDGFETLSRMRKTMKPGNEIPVIFLTADDNPEAEKKGLELGATDFIRKHILPEVLCLRVRHAIELTRLQRNLALEVDRKTKENENLSLRIVQSLAAAIDAKDTYTNGHSARVAELSRQIAARYGYSAKRQAEIYMTGLLHDVGKIGVPGEIIRKPGRLTKEEYEVIKMHPIIGEKILQGIRERPELAVGARWHHERYDGTGYPDGLAGEQIPETARIIAVADAYDAMTSVRAYRDALQAEKVRVELVNGKGVQFDPVFADIMLSIIDEGDTSSGLRPPSCPGLSPVLH